MQKKHTPLSFVYNIKKKVGYLKPHSLSKKIGLSKRQYRKCSIVDLLLGHWQLISMGQFSYDDWAVQISSITGKIVSGQAVCKRMKNECTLFLTQLLIKSMKQKYSNLIDSELFKSFKEVLIQDATHFSLPRCLSKVFPGSYSKYGNSATAKIQATISLKKGVFRDLKLFSFRDNDPKDASRIIPKLDKNDLIIRDLGYFVIDVFKQINKQEAFFLSRFKYNVGIYDLNDKKIDVMKIMRNKQSLDLDVKIGKKDKFKCRLVIVKLSNEIVQERIRKAKNNRNKRANHSKKYYEQLKYSIFITNVSRETWSVNQIVQAYKTRWYIEILFKGWKSHLKMKIDIPERYITKQRAEFHIYSSLLFVNLIVMPIFRHIQSRALPKKHFISILKLSSFINQNVYLIINQTQSKTIEMIKYYTTYESRKSRLNSIEMMYNAIY